MSNYREDRPNNNYSYSTLNETSNFTCEHMCTCKIDNERSQYDIDMLKKYQQIEVQPSPQHRNSYVHRSCNNKHS